MKIDPEKERAVAYQPYALKSSGGYARLTSDYTQRQP